VITHQQSTPMRPSRVVVLGASGFVGQDLVRHLQSQGTTVIARSSRDLDLRKPESVDRLSEIVDKDSAVVFISALTPDKGKDVRTLMTNLQMGEHVAACLENSSCAHMVYVSSDAVYQDDANPVRETSPCSPSSFHGLMHQARELMMVNAVRRSRTPLLIVRPTLVYGAGDTHNGYGPNRFIRTATGQGKITLFGNGEEKRDHLFIGDLSRLIGLCLEHRSTGILNAATGTASSFFDVAQTVVRLCRSPVTLECLPRSSAITHRSFDMAAMLRAFPSFRFKLLSKGLSEMVTGSIFRKAA
jgi:UDP-glucose 4-epimerase